MSETDPHFHRERRAELRVAATRALADCCPDCRRVLRGQLVEEEFRLDA